MGECFSSEEFASKYTFIYLINLNQLLKTLNNTLYIYTAYVKYRSITSG